MGIQVDELVKGKTHYGKEFINFEFDGKHISDFGMVAVFDGDRHTFSSTSDFEDETSEVAGVHGQYFWGTKIKALEKEFSLATDGMTERQLNEFKRHFQPGRYGKFIECAASNRYSYARISEAVEFKMLPFKKDKIFGGKTFYVTEYKGEATIKFVFDNPYSYAINKQFEHTIAEATPEELKIAYEDGIPFADSTANGNLIEITNQGKQFKFYNPSNSLALPIIRITLRDVTPLPEITPTGTDLSYYHLFEDEFTSPSQPYMSILLKKYIDNEEQLKEQEPLRIFEFTSPNIFYSYNKVINILINYSEQDKLTLVEKLREEITNPKILQYALAKLNDSKVSDGNKLQSDWQKNFNDLFKTFFYAISGTDDEGNPIYDTSGKDITLTIDSQNQTASISYYHLSLDSKEEIPVTEENCGEIMLTEYPKLEGGLSLDENFQITEYYVLLLENFKTWTWKNSIEFEYTYI